MAGQGWEAVGTVMEDYEEKTHDPQRKLSENVPKEERNGWEAL